MFPRFKGYQMCKYIGGCKWICQACRFWIGQGIHSLPFMFPGFLLCLEYFDISYWCLNDVKFLIISNFLTSLYEFFSGNQIEWRQINEGYSILDGPWGLPSITSDQKYFIMDLLPNLLIECVHGYKLQIISLTVTGYVSS